MSRNHLTKLNKEDIDKGGFVSVTTAAKHLDCSTSKIYSLIYAKRIKGYLIGGMKRILAEDLLDWITVNAKAL